MECDCENSPNTDGVWLWEYEEAAQLFQLGNVSDDDNEMRFYTDCFNGNTDKVP